MKRVTRRQFVIGLMLLILIPTSYWVHLKAIQDMGPRGTADVQIKVCYPGPVSIEVYRCEDYDFDGSLCTKPDLKYLVSTVEAPLHFYFEVESFGTYRIVTNNESRDFLVTKRSPDRIESFGCASDDGYLR